MSTIQTKIAAKKLTQETGVPDALADEFFRRGEGGHWLAIVDLEYLDHTEGRENKRVVRLELSQLEVVTGEAADLCRELMAATYRSRQPLTLDGMEGESQDEIIRRGRNVLLTCQVCIHDLADNAISHHPNPDADNAFCTWKSDGTEVQVDQEDPVVKEPATLPVAKRTRKGNLTSVDA
jgi:hypothetical protein